MGYPDLPWLFPPTASRPWPVPRVFDPGSKLRSRVTRSDMVYAYGQEVFNCISERVRWWEDQTAGTGMGPVTNTTKWLIAAAIEGRRLRDTMRSAGQVVSFTDVETQANYQPIEPPWWRLMHNRGSAYSLQQLNPRATKTVYGRSPIEPPD